MSQNFQLKVVLFPSLPRAEWVQFDPCVSKVFLAEVLDKRVML